MRRQGDSQGALQECDHASKIEEQLAPNSMAVATCGKDMMPSVRYVLLKDVNEGGFIFYTNYGSRKAQ